MTVSAPATWYNSGDDRGNDSEIIIPNVSSPASGTFALGALIHQHQGNATVTGITWGTSGATFAEVITSQGPNGRRNSIWRSYDAPAGETHDLTITLSGSNRPKGADCGFWTSDTGSIAIIGKTSGADNGTAISISVNPLAAGHDLIGCFTYGSGGGSVAPTSPTVELWDLDASGPGPDSDYWSARRPTTGTGAHAIAGTISGTTGWAGVVAEVTDDPPPPNFASAGGRAYTNGFETDAVAIAGGTSGSPASVREGSTLHVRLGAQNNSGAAQSLAAQIQQRKNGGTWVAVNASSVPARIVANENIVEGTATTQRLTAGTFTAGSCEDTDGIIAPYSVPNTNVTEVLFTVYVDPDEVAAADTLEFRINDQNSAPPSGTDHLYCSIVAASLPGIVAAAESVVSVENACSRWMFVDTNGAIYAATEPGWNQNHDPGKPPAAMRKSEDGGLTWRVVDFKDFLATGNGDLEGLHVVDLGSGLFGLVHIETGDDVYFDEWQASDHGTPDQWVTPLSTIVQDGADSLSALMTHATAAARQDGIVVAVYSNEPTGGGNDRLYWRRRSAGTWGPLASPGTELIANASIDYTGPVLNQGLASRSVLGYKASTGTLLWLDWASSANPPVWSGPVPAHGGGTAAALTGPIVGIVRYDNTNDKHALVYIDTADDLQLVPIEWSGSAYTVGTAVKLNTVKVESNWPGPTETEDLDNQGANAAIAVDPATGTVHVLYADSTNRDLYHQTWTEAGGIGTEALEVDAPAGQGVMFVDAQVFTHSAPNGGAKVLGYVYELGVGNATPPGRGMFYNEIALAAGVTHQVAGTSAVPVDALGAASITAAVSGSSPIAADATGLATITAAVAGSSPVAADATGLATVQRAVAGSSPVAVDSDGAIAALRGVAGAAPTAVDAAGTARLIAGVASSSTVAVDAAGAIDLAAAVAATAPVAVDAAGTARLIAAVSGTAPTALDAAAVARLAAGVAGAAPTVVDADGEISTAKQIAGQSPTVINAAGAIDLFAAVAGTSPVAADAAGAITLDAAVAGTSPVAVDVAGAIDLRAAIAATSPVAIEAAAVARLEAAVSGSSPTVIEAAGAIAVAAAVAGSSPVVTDATGAIRLIAGVSGSAPVAVIADAAPTLRAALAGAAPVAIDAAGAIDVAGTSNVEGTAPVAIDVAGSVDLAAAVAGSAPVAIDSAALASLRAAVSGSSPTVIDAAAVARLAAAVAGSAPVAIDAAGAIFVGVGVAGSAAVAIDTTGAIDVEGATVAGFAGTVIAATGAPFTQRAVAGTAPVAIDTDGTPRVAATVQGSALIAVHAIGVIELASSFVWKVCVDPLTVAVTPQGITVVADPVGITSEKC